MSRFLLSLTHMAMNSIAKVFWTTPRMKKLMKIIFTDENITTHEYVDIRKCFAFKQHFYTEAYQQLEDMILPIPSVVKRQLRTSIRVCGESLFTSLEYISSMVSAMGGNILDSMENFIENICLTDCGAVDVSATFRNTYRAEPLVVDYHMWIMACELCLEEYLLQWSPRSLKWRGGGELVEMVKLIFEDSNLKEHSDVESHVEFWKSHRVFRWGYYSHFLMYWKLWIFQNQTAADWSLFIEYIVDTSSLDFFDYGNIYDQKDSIEENMFRVSVVIGNFHAVKYFWSKMSTEAKSKGMVKMIAIACWQELCIHYSVLFSSYPTSGCDVNRPRRASGFDIIYFLIHYSPRPQLDELFSFSVGLSYAAVIEEFLPLVFFLNYEKNPEFCLTLGRRSLEYVGNNPFTKIYVSLMEFLLKALHQEASLHDEEVFDPFYQFWILGPADLGSETRTYLRGYWLDLNGWKFVSVLDNVIHHPSLPKFVEIDDVVEKYGKVKKLRHASQREYWRNRRGKQLLQ